MTDRLDAIKQRLAAATPGPWHQSTNRDLNIGISIRNERGILIGIDPTRDEDADLIAHAPDDLAYLLAAYDAALQREQAWKDRFRAIVGEGAPDSAGNAVLTLQRERDAYRKANESVAVCAAHVSEVTHADAIPYLVCHAEAANKRADTAERERDALRKKLHELLAVVSDLIRTKIRVARIQQEFSDDLADRDGNIYEQFKDFREQFYAERKAGK